MRVPGIAPPPWREDWVRMYREARAGREIEKYIKHGFPREVIAAVVHVMRNRDDAIALRITEFDVDTDGPAQ